MSTIGFMDDLRGSEMEIGFLDVTVRDYGICSGEQRAQHLVGVA